MNRLTAFTVWETLVAMIISGVVISFAIKTIPILSRSSQRIVELNSSINELLLLDQVFKQELHSCDKVLNGNEIEVVKGSKSTIYRFCSNSIIVIRANTADTLYRGEYSYSIKTLKQSEILVESILLTFPFVMDTITLNYPLRYPNIIYYGRDY